MKTIKPVVLSQYDNASAEEVVYSCNMQDVVVFFNKKGINTILVDDSSTEPCRAVISGKFLNMEFQAAGLDRVHGISSDVFCNITFKNGNVALPLNSFNFTVNKSSKIAEILFNYYLINASKLSEDFIHLVSEDFAKKLESQFFSLIEDEEINFDFAGV